jgi:DNA-binding protein H-NS
MWRDDTENPNSRAPMSARDAAVNPSIYEINVASFAMYARIALTFLRITILERFMPRLSADALKTRIALLQKQLAAAEQNKAPAIKKVQALMKKLGVTLADLGGAASAKPAAPAKAPKKPRKAGGTVAIKYRDEAGNTWTGRGKTPRWLVEAEKAGKPRESFKIPG